MGAVYDSVFHMKYAGGFSIMETYNLPVTLRNYYLKKLGEQLEKEAQQVQKASSSSK